MANWKLANPQSFGQQLRHAFLDLSKWLASPSGRRMPTFDTAAERDRFYTSPEPGDEAMVGVEYHRYSGTRWQIWDPEPIAYTPTLNGITVGTGGNAFSQFLYQREGSHNNLYGNVVLGSSGFAIATPCTLSTPSGMSAVVPTGTFVADRGDHGLANYVCAGTGYSGYTRVESASVVRLLANSVPTTYLQNVGITNLIPATWAAGNTLAWNIRYRLA